MSSVSEQDHLNPRDPLYYAPRWLRERSASFRDGDASTALTPSPANYSSRLESAVSDALRHPLDPEVMREPEQEKGARACREDQVLDARLDLIRCPQRIGNHAVQRNAQQLESDKK